jgi:hypothetical protein
VYSIDAVNARCSGSVDLRKQNVAIASPRCTAQRSDQTEDFYRRTIVGVHLLKTVSCIESNRPAVGRPERLSGIFRSRLQPCGGAIQRSDPKTNLSIPRGHVGDPPAIRRNRGVADSCSAYKESAGWRRIDLEPEHAIVLHRPSEMRNRPTAANCAKHQSRGGPENPPKAALWLRWYQSLFGSPSEVALEVERVLKSLLRIFRQASPDYTL